MTAIFGDPTSFEYEHCYDIFMDQLISTVIDFFLGILISFSNWIIEYFIIKSVLNIRYPSLTHIEMRKSFFTFVGEYINTAFVVYLIYAEINGFTFVNLINKIFNSEFLEIHNFLSDVDRSWYEKVASKLLMPLLISIFNPHITDFCWAVVKYWIQSYKARKQKKKKKLKKIYKVEEFDIAGKYKDSLKIIIVCLTFAAGIPIFYIFIFLGLLFTFFLHKYILIKFSERPAPYSNELIKTFYKILKFGLLIHMIFAMYLMSNNDIFPTTLTFDLEDHGHQVQKDDDSSISLADRIERIYPIFIFFVFFCLVFFFESVLKNPVMKLTRYLKSKKISTLRSGVHDTENTYEQIKDKIVEYSLPAYDMKSNPEYKKLADLSTVKYKNIRTFIK